jgi:hypothetical protein
MLMPCRFFMMVLLLAFAPLCGGCVGCLFSVPTYRDLGRDEQMAAISESGASAGRERAQARGETGATASGRSSVDA